MKFRTTLILLILVIGLGAFLLVYTARQPTVREQKEEQSRVLPAKEFQDPASPVAQGLAEIVTRLELRDGPSALALERTTSGLAREWRIVAPVRAPADVGAVTAILGELEFLRVVTRIEPSGDRPLDLKSYGLDPAERSITFSIGPKSWTLNIGSPTSDGQSVYIQRPDMPKPVVFVTPKSILEKASARLSDLRDKAALRFDKAAVTRVELLPYGGPALELRREAASWRLAGAVQDKAGADAVARLLDATAALRIEPADFLSDDLKDPAEFGLDKPRFKLTIFVGDTPLALCLGAGVKGDTDKCYARREGDATLFALGRKSADELVKSAADLRLKTALEFNPDEIASVSVLLSAGAGHPARTVRLVRSNGLWKMDEPPDTAADSDQAALFLDDLHKLDVFGWVDNPTPARLAEAGLAAPQIQVVLTPQPGAAGGVLLLGNPADKPDTRYARRGEQGPILIVPSDLAERLALGPLAFASRKMLEFAKDDAVALRLVRPGGTIVLEKKNDAWTAVEPADGVVNGFKLDDLLWGLSYLESKRIVGEKGSSLAEYGLDSPRIKVSVSLKLTVTKPPEVKTVLVGKELPDGASYAMMEGGGRIFVLGKPTVELFLADLVKAKKAAPKTAAPIN